MRQFFLLSVMSVLLLTMQPDAEAARRFGGGISMGRPAPVMMQKAPAAQPSSFQQAPRQASTQAASRPTSQPAPKPSMLGGMLTGLAAALGITALLSLLGVNGSGMVSFIMGLVLAFVAYMVISRLFGGRRTQSTTGPLDMPPPQDTVSRRAPEPEPQPEPIYQSRVEPAAAARTGSVMDELMGGTLNQPQASQESDSELASFDEASFLKVALQNYRKLQEAWATGQVLAISDFVSDDIFIAITHQMRERKGQQFSIDQYDIQNSLNGVMRQGDEYLASVRFVGSMTLSGEEEHVDENWLLAKPVDGSKGWLLVGISPHNQA